MKILPFQALLGQYSPAQAKARRSERYAPALILHRLTSPERQFGGLIAEVSVEGLQSGCILPHEQILEQRFRSISTAIIKQKVLSEPVLLGYPRQETIALRCDDWIENNAPTYTHRGDQLTQDYWVLSSDSEIGHIIKDFESVPYTYVADGHHRLGAVDHLYKTGQLKQPHFLAALFSFKNLVIHPYHRTVAIPQHQQDSILNRLESIGELVPLPHERLPEHFENFTLQKDNRWFGFTYTDVMPMDQSIPPLQASLFEEQVLKSIFGIQDIRSAAQIQYYPQDRLAQMKSEVQDKKDLLGFYLSPVQSDQFMHYCENRIMMPPKSTYFTPRMPRGFVHKFLDDAENQS